MNPQQMRPIAKLITALLIVMATGAKVVGQGDTLKVIDNEVNRINSDHTLTVREFDASEVYGHGFDGGGVIRVFMMIDEVRKIDQ